jgi:hypothetical protein
MKKIESEANVQHFDHLPGKYFLQVIEMLPTHVTALGQ